MGVTVIVIGSTHGHMGTRHGSTGNGNHGIDRVGHDACNDESLTIHMIFCYSTQKSKNDGSG